MTRGLRQASVVAAALALALVAAGAGAAADSAAVRQAPALTETKRSTFPERVYVLGLPRPQELTADQLVVLENGEPVLDATLTLPGAGSDTTFGVVLAVDASKSMEGDPIREALDAARDFSLRLPEGMKVGVVLFNNQTKDSVEPSDDPTDAANALQGEPTLRFGTRIYDAVLKAQEQLDAAGVDVGSIVLLSDGNDEGSRATEAQAIDAVVAGRSRVFTIGLESEQFDPAALRSLATSSGGAFALASSPGDLARVYASIGEAISSDYVLSYESFARALERVDVVVKVPGYTAPATARYVAPAFAGGGLEGPSLWDRIIQSPILAFVVGLLIVALVGVATYLLARRRDRSVERRLSAFVTLPVEEQARLRKEDVSRTLAEHQALSPIHRSIRELAFYKRLDEDVEVGRVPLSAWSLVLLTTAVTVLVAILGAALLGWWGVLFALLPPLVMRWWVERHVTSLQAKFAEQLPETLDIVSSALRAGHSLSGAMAVAVDGSPEPSRTELGRAVADDQLGVPLDDALRVVGHRMASRDVMQLALVCQLQREAGTNAAEVIDQVAQNIRNRLELQRLVKTLTAQGRMSRWIVSILPLFLFGAIFMLNREYLAPLWETNEGKAALIAAIVMIVSGSLVIKRIVEIEV